MVYERSDASRLGEDLVATPDPIGFLSRVQGANGLKFGSATSLCDASLVLLDVLGVPRAVVHERLLQKLKKVTLAKLDDAAFVKKAQEKSTLDALLAEAKTFLSHDLLGDVALKVLSVHPNPPASVLRDLTTMGGPAVDALPERIKSQMWEAHMAAFDDYITPFIQGYLDNHSAARASELFSAPALHDTAAPFPKERPERKDKDGPLAKLTAAVSVSPALLQRCLSRLRVQFAETGDVRLCALRANLIMTLHTGHHKEILAHEATFMFAWRLDAYTHHAMLFAQGGVKGDMSTLDDRVVSLLGEIRNIVGVDNFSSSRTSNAPETALATHFRKILVALRSMKIDVGGDKPLRARAVFGKPVVELYPNVRASYLALVGNPMDLGTMDKRYRHYESVDAFLSDLKLIRDNAYTFNGNYHEVSRAAAEILAQGERMCMDIPESVRTRVPKVPTSNSKRFKPLRSLGDAAMLLWMAMHQMRLLCTCRH